MERDWQGIKELQTSGVVQCLVVHNKLSTDAAFRVWYNSKTKKIMHDSGENWAFVSPARCYDELVMEMTSHPRWMKGQFI